MPRNHNSTSVKSEFIVDITIQINFLLLMSNIDAFIKTADPINDSRSSKVTTLLMKIFSVTLRVNFKLYKSKILICNCT